MKPSEPYAPRAVRFLELWQPMGWRIKVYGIAYRGETPSAALVDAAKRTILRGLPMPPDAAGRHGVGYVGVHEGNAANVVFFDWWANENEVFHHVWIEKTLGSNALARARPDELSACVWDVALMHHEREQWVRHVLQDARGDVAAYLAARWDAKV